MLSAPQILETLKNFPKEKLLVVTGREAPESLISLADLVTEMKEIKHPFQDGEMAKRGIEY